MRGLILLQNNFVCRGGEIDLIMLDKTNGCHEAEDIFSRQIVFVEVKYRKRVALRYDTVAQGYVCGNEYASAMESVGSLKQRRLIVAAKYFLVSHPLYADYVCRFDVCALQGDEILWQQDAFQL